MKLAGSASRLVVRYFDPHCQQAGPWSRPGWNGWSMDEEFRLNHYVPQWYQKRFLLAGQSKLFYRDLSPTVYRDAKRRERSANEVRQRGPASCFAERDLYTRFLGQSLSVEIERSFFHGIDSKGKGAVEAVANYSVGNLLGPTFSDFMDYLGTQKLRTPKGLAWVRQQAGPRADRNGILGLMVKNRAMYHAVWSECIWQIADASRSSVKFIVSDHPVTVYNRHCGPSSSFCRGVNDPDVVLSATHTLFPLGLEKLLILTNLTWARNPYQNPLGARPNRALTRTGLFKATDVQTERYLDDREVLEINFILRARAMRYVAAANPAWLFPEREVSKSEWRNLGGGLLLMPDPRSIHMGGTTYAVYEDGRSTASDEYGRPPWHPDFEKRGSSIDEGVALYRFKGEFARIFGPERRGRQTWGPLAEPARDSDELHAYHLEEELRNKKLMKGVRKWD